MMTTQEQNELLLPNGTEFVCIINKMGRIERLIFQNGINISNEKREMFTMGVRLQYTMQSDFDDEFGKVNYTITERNGFKFVSIPIHEGILFGILNESSDPFAFIKKISEMAISSKKLSESQGVVNQK